MAHSGALHKEQISASNPKISVIVSANAGTGKTKVLTDRFLRLMISGSDSEKILCLTYTNAAADEMKSRITDELKKWYLSDALQVEQKLYQISGVKPSQAEINRAKSLYLKILDNPDSLKIQTLHSFCESILKRFPFEAQISPHFELIDAYAQKKIITQVLNQFLNNENANSFYLINKIGLFNFKEVINEMIGKSSDIAEIITSNGGFEGYKNKLLELLEIRYSREADIEKIISAEFLEKAKHNLLKISKLLSYGSAANKKLGYQISSSLNNFDDVKNIFLTKDNKPRAEISNDQLRKAGVQEDISYLSNSIKEELLNIFDVINSHNIYFITIAFLEIFLHLTEQYNVEKANQNALDFNDLILKTAELLSSSSLSAWVMYKLDSRIDHILVDEAQDTSPNQWRIISALVEEFFSGETAAKNERTLFVVGDEKQSIYSFQGANLKTFSDTKAKYIELGKQQNIEFKNVSLNLSFRSLPAILQLVDTIFNENKYREKITYVEDNIVHVSSRPEHFGLVEIYPAVEGERVEKENEILNWQFLSDYQTKKQNQKPNEKLANLVAEKIEKMLQQGYFLPSKNRPLEPQDIIILVKNRDGFSRELIKKFNEKNIPNTGVDKLNIKDDIIYDDLIAVTKFLLNPRDDLNFACLLKSPLFNLSEENLKKISINRGKKSLYFGVKKHFPEIHKTLFEIKKSVQNLGIAETYFVLLETHGFRQKFNSRFGKAANEIIDNFLEIAVGFEKNNSNNLVKFLQFLNENQISIKKENSSLQNHVRIMTTHGSKGLQAPVVFLVDNNPRDNSDSNFIIRDNLFLASGIAAFRSKIYNQFLERIKEENYSEYLRLLYVALTRSADELYVFGVSPKEGGKDSWYKIISENSKKIGKISEDNIITISDDKYILESKKSYQKLFEKQLFENKTLPDFLKEKYQQQEVVKTISPSEFIKDTHNNLAKSYGVIMHKLFEEITLRDKNILRQKAKNIFDKFEVLGLDFETLFNEFEACFNSPNLAEVFSDDAFSEVPVMGQIASQNYSAIIDKLIITESEIKIIDIKTSSNLDVKNIKNQLDIYKKLLGEIYPNHKIKTLILSTKNRELIDA
jgi:ATP-dependent helicase/nuclease subunit A